MAFQFRNGGKDRQEIEGIVPIKSESCTFTPTNAECSKKSQEVKIEVVPFEVPWQQDRTDYPAQGLSCLRSLRGANQDKFFVYILRTPAVRLHGQLTDTENISGMKLR